MATKGGAAVEKTQDEILFAELKSKISAAVEIRPEAAYLVFVKKGVLNDQEKTVFISLWRRNFPGIGMLVFTVDDPERSVKVMEMARI